MHNAIQAAFSSIRNAGKKIKAWMENAPERRVQKRMRKQLKLFEQEYKRHDLSDQGVKLLFVLYLSGGQVDINKVMKTSGLLGNLVMHLVLMELVTKKLVTYERGILSIAI